MICINLNGNKMRSFLVIACFVVCWIYSIDCRALNDLSGNGNSADTELLLTPFIESGKLREGRQLSEVILPEIGSHLKSYSGFLTVNKTYHSNMFFWFCPALNGKSKDVPVLLWLAGGPGSSSVTSLFVDNGPLEMTKVNGEIKVSMRNYTWNREFAVLYIDNPVGAGFSFTQNDTGYVNNEVEVARDLYEALRQFFTLFEDYRGNPFYLTGKSYAGKYVPAIAHKIHSMGETAKKAGINLQGLAIGNGLSDEASQSDYANFLWQHSLIDKAQRDHFLAEQAKAVKLIGQGEHSKAMVVMNELFFGIRLSHKSYFENVTGLDYRYNFVLDQGPEHLTYYTTYLNRNDTRKALHVGQHPFIISSATVLNHLYNDIFQSVKSLIEELLNANYRIMFFNGNLDIIVAAPLTENFLQNLHWHKANKFYLAPRKVYKVSAQDKTVAGYVKQVDNLYFTVIRNAGHSVGYEQPRVALDLITRFVKHIDY